MSLIVLSIALFRMEISFNHFDTILFGDTAFHSEFDFTNKQMHASMNQPRAV